MTKSYLNQKYTKATIIVHWLTSLLILFSFPIGKYMEGIDLIDKVGLIKIHVFLGVLVFILTILRCIFYFGQERPNHIDTGSKLNNNFIKVLYTLFYLLLLSISISGIVNVVFNGYLSLLIKNDVSQVVPIGESLPTGHGFMAFIMMILLVLHVLGVVLHYFKTKENLLKRIS